MRLKVRHLQTLKGLALIGAGLAACVAAPGLASAEEEGYTHANPRKAIAAAEALAETTNKRVIIDFGGNWCGDCKALEAFMHTPKNETLLNENYLVVKVNVGDDGISQNFKLAKQYGIPLKKGVPALAVVDPKDHVIYSQGGGEFEDMRHMDPESVHEFLNHWKPAPAAGL